MNVARINGDIGSVGAVASRPGAGAASKAPGTTFQDELQRSALRFTRHAEERLQRRSISIDGRGMARLEEAVRAAESKGAVNSLVIMDGLALVVNVATRNVITACEQEALRDGVFTNIDSAVIVRGDGL